MGNPKLTIVLFIIAVIISITLLITMDKAEMTIISKIEFIELKKEGYKLQRVFEEDGVTFYIYKKP